MSALPYFTAWLFSFPVSFISDLLIKRNILTVQASRKICNTFGEWVPALALIGLGYVDKEHSEIAVAILVIAVTSNVAIYCGHNVNHMDLSPNFAGPLMGIINTVANIFSILAPLIVGVIVHDKVCIIYYLCTYYFKKIYVLIIRISKLYENLIKRYVFNTDFSNNTYILFIQK